MKNRAEFSLLLARMQLARKQLVSILLTGMLILATAGSVYGAGGYVGVFSEPGSIITVDGKEAGQSEDGLVLLELEEGSYRIGGKRVGYEEKSALVELKGGQVLRVNFHEEPWEGNIFTVSFESQGGGAVSPGTMAVKYGSRYGELPEPGRTGYRFGGWWTGVGGTGTQVTSDAIAALDEHTKLYAYWQIGEYIPMTYVEGDSYQMGSESGDSDEKPMHTVRIDSFHIGTYEVTQDIYDWVTSSNKISSNKTSSNGDNLPAQGVTWFEAIEFCNALSRLEGRQQAYTISGNKVTCDWASSGYRLPTEAEWEYAAKGGSKSSRYTYAGSNIAVTVAWYSGNSDSRTHPVGEKQPNKLGLYDMSGNVWEWCWDWYASSYYRSSPAANPTGPDSGTFRVLRGGSWGSTAEQVRTAARKSGGPEDLIISSGFRILLPADS